MDIQHFLFVLLVRLESQENRVLVLLLILLLFKLWHLMICPTKTRRTGLGLGNKLIGIGTDVFTWPGEQSDSADQV